MGYDQYDANSQHIWEGAADRGLWYGHRDRSKGRATGEVGVIVSDAREVEVPPFGRVNRTP